MKTKNSETEIGDIAVKFQERLREETGKEMTLVQVLDAFDQSIPAEAADAKLDAAEVAAALLILIENE